MRRGNFFLSFAINKHPPPVAAAVLYARLISVQEIESPGECRLKGKKAPFGAARVRIIYRRNKCIVIMVHLRRRSAKRSRHRRRRSKHKHGETKRRRTHINSTCIIISPFRKRPRHNESEQKGDICSVCILNFLTHLGLHAAFACDAVDGALRLQPGVNDASQVVFGSA